MRGLKRFFTNTFPWTRTLKIKLFRSVHLAVALTKAYIRHLLFPLPLFPIKLFTYSLYYIGLLLLKFITRLVKLAFYLLIWPLRSKKNFAKTVFWAAIFSYFIFTEYRFGYLVERFGGYQKFLCSEWLTTRNLQGSVVRVVGGYSEGSGFFVAPNQVLTSFHVIDGEPSPKVIFPSGNFTTPENITANKDADLALLYLGEKQSGMVLSFSSPELLQPNEPVMSAGYAFGTGLPGEVTVYKGNFASLRRSKKNPLDFLQINLDLADGMSGGPVVDQCGEVVGINTASIAGTSFFVSGDSIQHLWPTFTYQDIAKIKADPAVSPEEAVKAFYTYLKARRMEDGFRLLSREYLQKTDFEEWSNRFTDVLDVQIFVTKQAAGKNDTVFVKFSTKNWVDGEADFHFYEGTWQTVFEDGIYKMKKSSIQEVIDPDWNWFYEPD